MRKERENCFSECSCAGDSGGISQHLGVCWRGCDNSLLHLADELWHQKLSRKDIKMAVPRSASKGVGFAVRAFYPVSCSITTKSSI